MDHPALELLVRDRARRSRSVPYEPTEPVLTDLYRTEGGVRACMVSTVDGASHGRDGRSGSINDAADHRVFAVLRSWADVVLVGAGTVRTEGYGSLRTAAALLPARRQRAQPDHPALAILTRRGDLPVPVLEADPRPFVVTVDTAPFLGHLRAHLPQGRLLVHAGEVDLAAVVRHLADAGLPRVLLEGGPSLLTDALGRGLVDEVCLTQVPRVVGGDAGRVVGPGPWRPDGRWRLAHLLHHDGTLLGRWVAPPD